MDHETPATRGQAALRESCTRSSVAPKVGPCAAYAAKHDDASTGFGWAESYFSGNPASQRALAERQSCGDPRWMGPVEHAQLTLRTGENERGQRGPVLAFSHMRLVAARRFLPNLAEPGQATVIDPSVACHGRDYWKVATTTTHLTPEEF